MEEICKNAIKKIDDEAEAIKNTAAPLFASHIIDFYLTDEKNAKIVMENDKTLKNCFKFINGKAKQQAIGGIAMIKNDTVYEWVREYYGFAVDCKENPADNKIIDLLDFI